MPEPSSDLLQGEINRAQRQEQIANYVLRQSSVSVKELVDLFNVSFMTIHRDLDELEAQGILRKVRGGATAQPSNLFESDARYRLNISLREKEAIAEQAITHIEPGQAVMIDDSTTAFSLTRLLPRVVPLTMITYGLTAIQDLIKIRGVNVITLGGEYSPKYAAFVGLLCEQAVTSLRANILFLSPAAVAGGSLFQQEEEFVKVKRAMLASASKRVLLVDHTKFGKVALHRLASLQDFDLIIVDSGIEKEKLQELRDSGVPVEVAPLPEREDREEQKS
jgi:DeoR/GlpR family transcriptional regulator of sugar metabolism